MSNTNKNYLAVKVENHVFLKMFPIRVVINDADIHIVKGKEGVMAEVKQDVCNIQMNNGLHYTKKIPVSFENGNIVGVRVETYLSDGRLLGVLAVWLFLFLASFLEGVSLLKWLALIPILIIIGYAIFYKDKILLISNLQDKSYTDRYYEDYDNIIKL
jgi:hypothetical protein